jgi:hypothetical protein
MYPYKDCDRKTGDSDPCAVLFMGYEHDFIAKCSASDPQPPGSNLVTKLLNGMQKLGIGGLLRDKLCATGGPANRRKKQ